MAGVYNQYQYHQYLKLSKRNAVKRNGEASKAIMKMAK